MIFTTIKNAICRLPVLSFLLFGHMIPAIFVALTIMFILIHLNIVCSSTILDLLFIDIAEDVVKGEESSGGGIIVKFLEYGSNFVGYFIDLMINIINLVMETLLGDTLDSIEEIIIDPTCKPSR
jgi:hypothetical protein